mmetsp:Transcript_11229/g.23669  ORF Transcript_11229/g.23669 Transcript_11229/m.23669 type:complete len:379 (-) Transcript_11229:314-1450(-)|eukprot:CAMPEP_0171345118 /NCGR_PEP_ID=MMETSP0878-20121228/20896_1 /TAXON_ID=67004 /ORGANISM="Thalassiosira weissflogii, Strain CCMP1336" /LENGTH=378 /DNA_ID=CAMNT_0011848463 /DNA_START=85 /DNA_END=1221 /DNA_ORIENTATION=-
MNNLIRGFQKSRLIAHRPNTQISLNLPTRTLSTTSAPPSLQETRGPSALEKANLPLLTPGHAIGILQSHGSAANNKNLLRRSDFVALCQSSRPGKTKDAKVIATALREFKRCNNFILHEEGARAAVEGMMRSMIPNYKVVFGKLRLEGCAFVLERILERETGLYFSVGVDVVDGVLEEVKKGINELVERGVDVRVFGNGSVETGDGEEAGGKEGDEVDLSDEQQLVKKSMELAQGVTKLLIERRSLPENNMKKRARRAYKKLIQVNDGPAMSTLALASEISIMVGGPDQARENVISPFEGAWWTKKWTSGVDQAIIDAIAEAEKKQEEERVTAGAAAAEAQAAAEEEAIQDVNTDANAGETEESTDNREESSHDEPKK